MPTEICSVRVFDPSDANRALDLVASITGDIVEKWRELDDITRRRDREMPSSESEEAKSYEDGVRRLTRELQSYVTELSQVGCTLRDVQNGVVDFPAVFNGVEVSLSWMLGETEVSFWYQREGGFASRQPIAPDDHVKFLAAA